MVAVSAAIILVLADVGCTFRQSESLRAASFAPFADRRIGHVPSGDYLKSRVALLVSTRQDPTRRFQAGDMTLPPGSGFGCAAAVDHRGYFLTADHCLGRPFVHLIHYDGRNSWISRARVVWRGGSRKGGPDVAILHVEQDLKAAFGWAREIRKGGDVMTVGIAWKEGGGGGIRAFELMGGRILGTAGMRGEAGDLSVANDLPLQPGDSGGPLTDAGGGLLGITVRATPPIVHRILPKEVFSMVAERPNEVWIRRIIDRDAAQRQAETGR